MLVMGDRIITLVTEANSSLYAHPVPSNPAGGLGIDWRIGGIIGLEERGASGGRSPP